MEASSRRQKQARAPIAVRQEEAWGVAAHRAEAGRRCWCQEEAGEAAPGGPATAGSGRGRARLQASAAAVPRPGDDGSMGGRWGSRKCGRWGSGEVGNGQSFFSLFQWV